MKLIVILNAIFLFAGIEMNFAGDKSASTRPVFEPVRNPGFETNDLAGWSLIAGNGGNGQVDMDTTKSLGETNTHSLRLTVREPGERCGMANDGLDGINVRAETWYDLSFYARTEKRENGRGYGLTVSLENRDGTKVCARTTIPEVGGEWNHYQVALHTRLSDAKGRLTITVSEPGVIWFDGVLLKARRD